MTDETVFWLAWWLMAVMAVLNIILMGWQAKIREETRDAARYVRKANRDFAEAAALLKYGAVDEAIELLAKYDREDAA